MNKHGGIILTVIIIFILAVAFVLILFNSSVRNFFIGIYDKIFGIKGSQFVQTVNNGLGHLQ